MNPHLTKHDTAQRIRRQRDKYGWDTAGSSSSSERTRTPPPRRWGMNTAAANAATFQADAAGARASFRSGSRKAAAMRVAAACPGTAVAPNLAHPLSELVVVDEN